MIRHRTTEEVRRYDIFKLLVVSVLIAILIFQLYQNFCRLETGAETETESSSGPVSEDAYIMAVDDWLSKLANKYFRNLFPYPAIVMATNQKNQDESSFAVIENSDLSSRGGNCGLLTLTRLENLSKLKIDSPILGQVMV